MSLGEGDVAASIKDEIAVETVSERGVKASVGGVAATGRSPTKGRASVGASERRGLAAQLLTARTIVVAAANGDQ